MATKRIRHSEFKIKTVICDDCSYVWNLRLSRTRERDSGDFQPLQKLFVSR